MFMRQEAYARGKVTICHGSDKKCPPHRPVYLNSWSPVGATVWEGCGTSGTLLGEVHL